MQLTTPGHPHLSYCSNVHPGESWSECFAQLQRHVPAVRSKVSPNAPFGLGLRLSAAAACELTEPAQLAEFRAYMAANALYVFTVNAFPYGAFHGRRVKERVYDPDWRDPKRLRYTCRVADILAKLIPEHHEASISTVPGAFQSHVQRVVDVQRMRDHFLACAIHLQLLAQRTTRVITLAIEPEPACFIETTRGAIRFLEDWLFTKASLATFADGTGLNSREAEDAIRRHIGLCVDVCHAAVAFEDIASSIDEVINSGIRILKMQLSSALKVTEPSPITLAALSAFNEGVYLHQTAILDSAGIRHYKDLPDALACDCQSLVEAEWRVHCHIPLYADRLGPLQTTQDLLCKALAIVSKRAITSHLEVETYTWSSLPQLLQGDLASQIARELKWVHTKLAS